MARRLVFALCLVGLLASACTGEGSVSSTTDTFPPTSTAPASTAPTSFLSSTTTPTVTSTTVSYASQPLDVGPLSLRGGHSVVWTGEEMIVWGGDAGDGGPFLADGAAYNPDRDSWRMVAPAPLSPRAYHVAAWTGEAMLIVGGPGLEDGASYDPSTDTWTPIAESPVPHRNSYEGSVGAAWTGDELLVWSAADDVTAAYDPQLDEWTLLGPIGIDVSNGSLRWTGEQVYAFGDNIQSYPSETALLGASLDGNEWQLIPSTDFSTDTHIVAADARLTVWIGNAFLAWSTSGNEGKTMSYTPDDETWVEASTIPIPPCEGQGEPTLAGDRIVVFGSCGSNVAFHDPVLGGWTSALVPGFPTARYTVWTGTELLNWGGGCCPAVEAWRYTPD